MSECHILTPFARDPAKRLRPKPKGVQKARLKHRPPPVIEDKDKDKDRSPFLEGFFTLPPELRLQIYRLLLIRPCKFDLLHAPLLCGGSVGFERPNPYKHPQYQCVDCSKAKKWKPEATHLVPRSQRLSAWAPPNTSPWVCDFCHMERRPVDPPHPSHEEKMSCLCARRKNLGVLLMSRRVYGEASEVFWGENWFAFERAQLLHLFLSGIRPATRTRIGKVCLLGDVEETKKRKAPDALGVEACWPLLRECTGLRVLEVDEVFLSRVEWVLGLRTLRVQREVRFVMPTHKQIVRMPGDTVRRMLQLRFIWPWVSHRVVIDREGTRELAATMVGEKALSEQDFRELFWVSLQI